VLHVAADASYDDPICSCGYVITKSTEGSETLVDNGFRVLNTQQYRPEIPWCCTRGEYRALITGVRAALDHTENAMIVYSDSKPVVNSIREDDDRFNEYFPHAFRSFASRFADWHVSWIDRERNELAHEQARVGLKTARKLLDELN